MSNSKNLAALALVLMLCTPLGLLQSTACDTPLRMRIDLSTSYASYIGEVANDNSGFSFAISGDVNGDGFDDLLIGANLNDDGGADAGKVYLFFGNSTGWAMDIDLSNSNASFVGEDGFDYAGYAVAIAGDVNNDGFDDILIGAQGDDDGGADAGQVYLILGKATGWDNDVDLSGVSASFWGEDAGDAAGISVAGAGDVNADGYDDIIIGAINDDDGGANAGQVYLILGRAAWAMDADLSASSASFWGEDAADIAGRSVAGAKDVNRDGYDDILVGAPGDDDGGMGAGQAYLILGKPTGWAMDTDLSAVDASFWGESVGDNSAYAVSSAGDINGDGYDDILIPANQDDDGGVNAGQSYIFLGKALGWAMDTDDSAADASFWGESAGDDAGRYVAPAGDVNGDGYDDFLIGAPQEDDGGNAAGQTYLILGKAAGWVQDRDLSTAEASYIGEDAGDFSGICVAGDGDVNGDGLDDILIGAYSDDDGGNNAGQSYLIMNVLTPPPPTGLKASLTGDGGPITLNWSKPEYWRDPFSGFRVYRSMDGDHYDLLSSLPPSARSYVDSNVELGKVYNYAVQTVDASGSLSGLSKTVSQLCDNDTDLDTIGNLFDLDDDGDGVPDGQDDFPLDLKESLDTDLDGTGNSADLDDDNDGISDLLDAEPLNPLNSIEDKLDLIAFTLDNVHEHILDLGANLTYMNSTLLSLNANVTSMNLSLSGMMGGLHDDMVGMNSTLLAAMAGMNSSILDALTAVNSSVLSALAQVNSSVLSNLAQVNSSILSTLSQMNDSVQSALLGVNSTLLSTLAGLNASLRAELVGMNSSILAQIAASNSSLYEALMGHNATVLSALSGLNDTVLAELGTVESHILTELAGVNSTVLSELAIMNSTTLSELSGMNTSILTGLWGVNSSLHSHLNTVNSSLAALLGDLHNDLVAVNGSLTTKLTAINSSLSKVGKDLAGLNLTLRADHKDLKDLLGKINTNLTWLMNNMVGGDNTNVLSAIANLSAQLSGTNASLQQGIVDLEVRLDADIQALQLGLDAANMSLNAQMTGLDADMANFRGNVTSSLNVIIGLIKDLDLNQSGGQGTNVSKEITKLQTLVENINSTTLTQISNQLDEIQRTMPGSGGDPQNISLILTKVTALSSRLDVFRTETLTRLDNITKMLKALDQINSMASDIDNITKELVSMKADLERLNTIDSDLAGMKKALEDVKDEETKTRNAVTVSSTGTPIAIILLLILVMVMMALNILRTRDLKAQGTATKKRMDEGFAEIGALKTVTYGMTQRVEELANRPIPEPQIRYIERPAEPAQAPDAANEGAYEVAPEAQPESPKEPAAEARVMEAQEAEQEIGPKDSKDQVGQHGEPSIDVILKKLKKHKK